MFLSRSDRDLGVAYQTHPGYNVGDLGLIPRLGRFPGEGNGYQLQFSGLENAMDCKVHGVTKSQTRLSNYTLMLTLYLFL